ncbi:hypothetical protein FOXYSP1_05411 [Fusarium oxysporum f. sp. phaseoli]
MLWLSNFPTLATVVSLKVGTNGASMTAENPVQASCVGYSWGAGYKPARYIV